jgi:hypothetical protein
MGLQTAPSLVQGALLPRAREVRLLLALHRLVAGAPQEPRQPLARKVVRAAAVHSLRLRGRADWAVVEASLAMAEALLPALSAGQSC